VQTYDKMLAITEHQRKSAMEKKTPIVPPRSHLLQSKATASLPIGSLLRARCALPGLWLWSCLLLSLGVSILVVVGITAGAWIRNIHVPTSLNQHATPPPITTFTVQRTAPYAGLHITVMTAQYASSFVDDDIHLDSAVVRLTLHVANSTANQISVVYYDCARLLIPNLQPLAPTNVHLAASLNPGTSATGWLDFSVPDGTHLESLTFQLGSPSLHEWLVRIPFQGAFDASRYADTSSRQTLSITYNYNNAGPLLTYHLTKVDVRFSYQGSQCQAGKHFYILSFLVDNPNDVDVSPGPSFQYVRLIATGNTLTPVENTLPATLKAGTHGVAGQVIFMASAGLKMVTVTFLSQNSGGHQDYDLNL
jgi:hypothetical protein